MQRLSSFAIGVDQGNVSLFSDFEAGGPMWVGHGSRTARARVTFSEPFAAVPAVTVGLSLWDFAHETNTRADLSTENVTEEGFTILFRTWNDTRIARVRVSWQAIGPLKDDDLWEIG
jgi:hypothetical protein